MHARLGRRSNCARGMAACQQRWSRFSAGPRVSDAPPPAPLRALLQPPLTPHSQGEAVDKGRQNGVGHGGSQEGEHHHADEPVASAPGWRCLWVPSRLGAQRAAACAWLQDSLDQQGHHKGLGVDGLVVCEHGVAVHGLVGSVGARGRGGAAAAVGEGELARPARPGCAGTAQRWRRDVIFSSPPADSCWLGRCCSLRGPC
jgi:hypothetical protein